jgi:large subunit ribosomal protein L25
MSHIVLEAEARNQLHKGASRRLRRLDGKVPAVLYGGSKGTHHIQLDKNKLNKALESEAIFSSLLTLTIDGKKESVILKDLQRHPYKAMILHVDFQRISGKDVLVKEIPLHFINEDKAPGVADGGIVTHTMNQVEIRCQAKDLPEFIEVDLANLALNDVLHLSDIKLPKSVKLAHEVDPEHDNPVVSIHMPRVEAEPEPELEIVTEEVAEAEDAQTETDESSATEEEPAAE